MSKGLPKSHKRGDPLIQEVIKYTLPIDSTVNVAAAGSAIGFGSVNIGGLPEGNVLLLGAVAQLRLSTDSANLVAGWHGDFGIGYIPTADADLGDAFEDAIIPSTTIDADGSTKASLLVRGQSTQTEQSVIYDNTNGTAALVLNVLIDAADISNDTNADLRAQGFLHVAYIMLGDD